MKRLIYCLDGTSNEYDTDFPTNVVMMEKSVSKLDDNEIEQISYYRRGVGTKWGEKILGGVFGYGLLENIIHAYKHLCENYEAGDQIYIFGFSRGAFTARSFAGLIGWCGIVDSNNITQIEQAKKYYKKRLLKEDGHLQEFNQWRMDNCTSVCANENDYVFRQECLAKDIETPEIIRIRYIGVWDTVKTLGLLNKYEWHDDHLSPQVDFARHAVALDERRKKFDVTEWGNIDVLNNQANENGREGKPYQQVWFTGTHGSVGGGGIIRGLSDEAFQWIREGAKEAGLAFIGSGDAEIFSLKPNPLAWLFNSTGEANTFSKKTSSLFFKGLYRATGIIDRTGPKSMDEIHWTVLVRYFAKKEYLPERELYRSSSLKLIEDALSNETPPFDDVDYRSLYESSKVNNLADDEEKIVTIDDSKFLVYTVKKGDTLSLIAQKLTGKLMDYLKIHEANEASIPNVDLIYIGQRVFIPLELIQ